MPDPRLPRNRPFRLSGRRKKTNTSQRDPRQCRGPSHRRHRQRHVRGEHRRRSRARRGRAQPHRRDAASRCRTAASAAPCATNLLVEVRKLAEAGRFDTLVIESTGISEPLAGRHHLSSSATKRGESLVGCRAARHDGDRGRRGEPVGAISPAMTRWPTAARRWARMTPAGSCICSPTRSSSADVVDPQTR